MMTPSEYQKLAARTLLPEPGFEIPGNQLMLVWCAIGLVGEAGEVAEAFWKKPESCADRASRISKECGDYCWYLAGICTTANLDFGKIIENAQEIDGFPEDDPVTALQMAASRIAETVKKGVFHRHGISPSALELQVSGCFYYLVEAASEFDISVYKAMDENIAKLRLRYPDGFTGEDSKRRVDVEPRKNLHVQRKAK